MRKLKCTRCNREFGISAKKNEKMLDHYLCPDCTKKARGGLKSA